MHLALATRGHRFACRQSGLLQSRRPCRSSIANRAGCRYAVQHRFGRRGKPMAKADKRCDDEPAAFGGAAVADGACGAAARRTASMPARTRSCWRSTRRTGRRPASWRGGSACGRRPSPRRSTGCRRRAFSTRRASETDARQAHIFLTETGRETIRAIEKSVRKTEKQALKGLDKKDQKALSKLLARIEANLSDAAIARRRRRDRRRRMIRG